MGQFKSLYEAAKEITRDELLSKAKEYAKSNANWVANDGYDYTATLAVNSKLIESVKFYLTLNGGFDGAKLKFEVISADRALSGEELTKYPDIQREIKKIIDKSGIKFKDFIVEQRKSSSTSESAKGISPAFVKNLGKLFSVISKANLSKVINDVTDKQKPSAEIIAKFQKATKITLASGGINRWTFKDADQAAAITATRKFGTSMFGSNNQTTDSGKSDRHSFVWQASRFTFFNVDIKKDGSGEVTFSYNR